jgi:hypothetical protein
MNIPSFDDDVSQDDSLSPVASMHDGFIDDGPKFPPSPRDTPSMEGKTNLSIPSSRRLPRRQNSLEEVCEPQ